METISLHEALEREAAAANRALGALTDEGVGSALQEAARLAEAARDEILGANEADVEAAAGRLDDGALDRLRLDDRRLSAIADQLRTMAALPPLEREIASWTLPNGRQVSELRIPVGVVG